MAGLAAALALTREPDAISGCTGAEPWHRPANIPEGAAVSLPLAHNIAPAVRRDFDLAYGIVNWSNADEERNDASDCPGSGTYEDFMIINSSCPWIKNFISRMNFVSC